MALNQMLLDALWPDEREQSKPTQDGTSATKAGHIEHRGPEQTHWHRLDLWKTGYRALYLSIGEEPVAIVFSQGYRQIVETSTWMEKEKGIRVLWVSREIRGMRLEMGGQVIGADLWTIKRFLELRKNRKNVVLVMVHMAAPHTAPWHMKQAFPDVKVVSFVYDFMDLWVPPDKLDLWDQYINAKGSNAAEYHALVELRKGTWIEGLLYKDYGPGWPHLADCRCPTAWMPAVQPKQLFQPPAKPDVGRRFLFIGTIMPKATHDRPAGLFSDIMMERIFREVTDQGYQIHAYLIRPHRDVIREYEELFPERTVRIMNGDYLWSLMHRLAGRYRWGWMLYHFPQPVILRLVQSSLPSKFFTYLALGIPPVVSAEFEAAARIVREYECGVVVTQDEIPRVGEILEAQDYERLTANLVACRDRYSLEKHIGVLGHMVEQAIEAPRKVPPKNPKFIQIEEKYIRERKREEGDVPAAAVTPECARW